MKIVRNILLIALALLLQSTLFSRYTIAGMRPDLALLALILLVSSSGQVGSVLYGFLIGFIQDVYSPEFLGTNALTMSIMGFLLDLSKERLAVENYSVKALVCFITCIIHDVIFLSFYTKFDHSVIMLLLIRESLFSAVYTSALLILLFILWEWATGGGFKFVVQKLFRNRR